MNALCPYLISSLSGLCLMQLLTARKNNCDLSLKIFLGSGLGIGLNALTTFLSFILFNRLVPLFAITLNLLICVVVIVLSVLFCLKNKTPVRSFKKIDRLHLAGIAALTLAAVPLWYQSDFYAYGGWDAWSAWNLKAKFLFLGGDQWRNMFEPVLWRSSPHYPLLLPLINVWGWLFTVEPVYQVPVITAFLFTFLSVGLVYTGLKKLTGTHLSLIPALVLLTLPIFNKLSLSQYSDNVLGFYLLASLFSLAVAKNEQDPAFVFLAGIFLGLLSFTKPEGLIAAILIALISLPYLCWQSRLSKK